MFLKICRIPWPLGTTNSGLILLNLGTVAIFPLKECLIWPKMAVFDCQSLHFSSCLFISLCISSCISLYVSTCVSTCVCSCVCSSVYVSVHVSLCLFMPPIVSSCLHVSSCPFTSLDVSCIRMTRCWGVGGGGVGAGA